jgi:murein L,D-transpeptidase YcbB/YkuD
MEAMKSFVTCKQLTRILAAVVWLAVAMANPLSAALPADGDDPAAGLLAAQIQAAAAQARYRCRGELVCGIALIPEFYAARDYRPAWTGAGALRPAAAELLAAIASVDRYGLAPDDYHLQRLRQITRTLTRAFNRNGSADSRLRADYDLLMTDAFFLLTSHVLGGRVNPERIHPEWEAYNRETDLSRLLSASLQSSRITALVDQLHPPHAGFKGLQRALTNYRRIAAQGGWETIPPGPRLEYGMENEAVGRLRQRLARSGDLTDIQHFNPYLFDRPLARAVVAFQTRHGIQPDGVVGPQTRRAMNVPVSHRIRQLEINMERWRWIPKDLGRRYLMVNIADYTLVGFADGQARLQMRVIVGRSYRKTPVFSEDMTYLVLNPYWQIPSKLAIEDVLPKIQKNPGYMQRQGIRVFSDWSPEARELTREEIDWQQVAAGHFGLRLRQDPGPRNALGRIKFMLPNKHAVYLHDTPAREQFDARSRSFSSGCIRVEDPIGLAAFVLGDTPGWDREALQATISAGERRAVRLDRPLPVHILYWTAWADASGQIHFRDDIYGRDAPLAEALRARRVADKPT